MNAAIRVILVFFIAVVAVFRMHADVPRDPFQDDVGVFTQFKLPVFRDEKSFINHIFRTKEGHFSQDTPENRQYILAAASNPENRVAIDNYGVGIYLKAMFDGRQAWAHVRNGEIANGGV